ncbi:hypothetical protein BDV11DRAFT_199594 [Aspergillus similis]
MFLGFRRVGNWFGNLWVGKVVVVYRSPFGVVTLLLIVAALLFGHRKGRVVRSGVPALKI